MEAFPGNSQRTKPAAQEVKPEREKIERVVTSEVIQRKRPLGKRFMETFVGGDAKGTLLYVVADILVPAAKDMVADAVTQGFERMIFGESRSGNRRSGSRPSSGANGFVSYNRMGSNRAPDRQREDPRGLSRRARTNHEFDEIILATRAEGEEVIDRLGDLIGQYEVATVADLYELVGITSQHTDGKWGWDDMRGARVERVRSGGYLLDLPKTMPVD
jgi:hypothetical protein